MNRIIFFSTLGLVAVSPVMAQGADFPESANRFSLGARFGMNFKANFHNDAPVNPGLAIGGVNHFYNDGYVLVDSSGNAGGLTWNWGYRNPSQVVGDTMQFHAIQSANDRTTADLQYGAELTYQRVLGSLPFLAHARWGLEAAFGFTDLDIRDNPDTLITDTFQLNGVVPPGAGYNGTFAGPGALLGDTPTRSITSNISTLPSHQSLSGQIYSLRLGPFVEWNFTPRLGLSASVGLTIAPTSVDYRFSETTTLPGGGTFVASGRSSNNEVLYGPYASTMLRFDFNESWGVYIGAQFQRMTGLHQSIGTRSARLDQGATIYGLAGVSWRF